MELWRSTNYEKYQEIINIYKILADSNDFEELTQKLYEQAAGIAINEEKIILGLKLAKQYNWENSSKLLWQAILKTMN